MAAANGWIMSKIVYYASIGSELTLYDVDVDGAALTKRSTVTLPANIQYVWPHPSRRYLYVVSSNGGPGLMIALGIGVVVPRCGGGKRRGNGRLIVFEAAGGGIRSGEIE